MDQDRFYNYYIETLNTTLQDAIGKNIVFQVQARIAKEDLDSLGNSIQNLNDKLEGYGELEQNLNLQGEALNSKNLEIQNLVRERDHAKHEASHIETFRNELVAARQELQQKNVEIQTLKATHEKQVSSMKAEFDIKMVSLKSDCDKILLDLELRTQKEIKELKEKVAYGEMTPAQKRKFNNLKNKQFLPEEETPETVEEKSNKESYVEKEHIKPEPQKKVEYVFDDAESEENKDGGTF